MTHVRGLNGSLYRGLEAGRVVRFPVGELLQGQISRYAGTSRVTLGGTDAGPPSDAEMASISYVWSRATSRYG